MGAILLINFRPGGEKAGSAWLLLLQLLAGGTADSLSKVFGELGNGALSGHFLLYTFLSALVLCTLLTVRQGKVLPEGKTILFGLLVGVPNYFSAKFLLGALVSLPAVVVYPVVNVGTILAVTAAGVLLFRERPTKRQWIALGMILAALVLLNL